MDIVYRDQILPDVQRTKNLAKMNQKCHRQSPRLFISVVRRQQCDQIAGLFV